MPTTTPNLGLNKAADADNAEVYLHTNLAASMDVLDNAVTLTGSQTLTNKTLTAPVLNGTLTGTGGFNAWTTWTPTANQNGALTLTVNSCRYSQIGKTVTLSGLFTITQAGSAGSDLTIASLPVTAFTSNADLVCGTFAYYGATKRQGAVILFTTSSLKFQVDSQAGYLGTAPSMATANGDVISFQLTYEAA